jgi:squalene-hopene/tetraprenyl-beta-curcumene cyclase
VQRPDGAWDWLNFGLEPYETTDAVFYGATLAAMAVGRPTGDAAATDKEATVGLERLRSYLRTHVASERLFNRAWALLAASRLSGAITDEQRDAIVRELTSRQRPDGGWALTDLGTWRWSKTEGPFVPPGKLDLSVPSDADAYATGLVVYALKQANLSATRQSIDRGLGWLRAHQQAFDVDGRSWKAWRAHSLNFDREHGGDKGEPWRRLFMSDLATAFAVLALS